MNKRKIAYVLIIAGVVGIISSLLGFLFSIVDNKIILYLWRGFDFFAPNIMPTAFSKDLSFLWFLSENGYVFDVIGIFLCVVLLLGGIQYVKSDYQKKSILLFVLSIVFFEKILLITNSIFSLPSFISNNEEFSVMVTIQLTHMILWAIISFFLIKKLNVGIKVLLIKPRRVDKYKRFIHFVVDSIIYTLFASSQLGLSFRENIDGSVFNLFVLIVLGMMYYFVFELVLGSTPGKYLTGSKVILNDQSPLKSVNILIRTISRYIPFELLFALFQTAPWHDNISGTSVVDLKYKFENGK